MAQISTASVIAYCGTGFSMINTPATPAVLASSASSTVDLGIINCLSLIGQRSGTIRVRDFSGIATADYLRIVFSDNPIPTYWLITGYEYLSSDTLAIGVVLDGFLTCGGTAGITSISGYVKRHTVTDDTYGKYNQEDPLLIPSQNLIFRSVDVLGTKPANNRGDWNIVLSTINLYDLGEANASDLGITYGDSTLGTDINLPELPAMRAGWYTEVTYTASYSYKLPGVQCFNGDSPIIKEGIARARKLGIEGGIIAQYGLPEDWFDLEYDLNTTYQNDVIMKIGLVNDLARSYFTSIGFNFANVVNKRALYGSYETVQLCSMSSGELVEYDIEDLYSSSYPSSGTIQINLVADGRAHGKPIFYPLYYRGNQQYVDNLLSSVRGMEWQNVPLVYTYASREGIDRIRFFEGKKIDAQNILEGREIENFFMPQEKAWSLGGDLTTGNFLGAGMNAGKTLTTDVPKLLANRAHEDNMWARARNYELKNFLIDTRVVSPELHFAPSESVRDFVGNGVIVGFVTPTDSDLARFDKILTMYGYQDAGTALTLADLTAGLNFSYIEATGVQIQTNVAVDRNIREMAEKQVEAGIRIWKSRPDFSKYDVSNR